MAWYYVTNGTSQGPVSEPELRRLRSENVIALDTPIWTEGMAEWTPFLRSPLGDVATPGGVPVATQTCAECARVFPEDEMLKYENSWVCAACKPVFFQRVKEGVAMPGTMNLASIGARWIAIIIDYFVIIAGEIVFAAIPYLLLATLVVGNNHEVAGASALLMVPVALIWIGLPIFYEIFLIGKYGATFGKMVMKVKVVTATGERVTYGRATGRFFAKALSRLIAYVGYLIAIWDDETRTLHDMICDTRVVNAER